MLENRRVVTIAYDGLCAFEFGIASELFGLSRPELGVAWYDYRVVAASAGPLRATGGITVTASTNLRHVRAAGTIVLPGWKDKDEPIPVALISAIRAAHARGARVMSICSGVYVLAATGLLDGKTATTHWRYAEHLAHKFPAISVKPNVLYVDNGSILTSAGSAAGIDLGLHLIRRDYGATIAAEVARRLVMAPQREGGQAQFISHVASVGTGDDQRINQTMTWAQANLDKPLTVADLAQRSHMSLRTFARRFADDTGVSPMAWILTQRLRLAQQLLETTQHTIDEIATVTGFATAETLRYHVRRELETSPTRYRSSFAR
jgi:AraC family transcriptional regulator, transcriptional activator FtrA